MHTFLSSHLLFLLTVSHSHPLSFILSFIIFPDLSIFSFRFHSYLFTFTFSCLSFFFLFIFSSLVSHHPFLTLSFPLFRFRSPFFHFFPFFLHSSLCLLPIFIPFFHLYLVPFSPPTLSPSFVPSSHLYSTPSLPPPLFIPHPSSLLLRLSREGG